MTLTLPAPGSRVSAVTLPDPDRDLPAGRVSGPLLLRQATDVGFPNAPDGYTQAWVNGRPVDVSTVVPLATPRPSANAGHRAGQPRVPAGSPEGGQFAGVGGHAAHVVSLGRKSGLEHSLLLDRAGNRLAEASGTEGATDLPSHQDARRPGAGLTVVHNHPDSSPLSPQDLKLFAKYPGVNHVVAAGHDGSVHGVRVVGDREAVYREADAYEQRVRGATLDKLLALKSPTDTDRRRLKAGQHAELGRVAEHLEGKGLVVRTRHGPTGNSTHWSSQPRVPAGSEHGGEWTDGGGAGVGAHPSHGAVAPGWEVPLYHATATHNVESIRKTGFRVSGGTFGEGVYFSLDGSKSAATGSSGSSDAAVLKARADVKNPLVLDLTRPPSEWDSDPSYALWMKAHPNGVAGEAGKEGRKKLLDMGYDGVQVKFAGTDYRVVLDPKLIKLDGPTGNASQERDPTRTKTLRKKFAGWLAGNADAANSPAVWRAYLEGGYRRGAKSAGHSPTKDAVRAAVKALWDKAAPLVNEAAGDNDVERLKLIANTELIRSHANGTLAGITATGGSAVVQKVEWKATGSACGKCLRHAGQIVSVNKAAGLIPFHPRCRCTWVAATPATVNAFCPTGPGGGVDPSCSPHHPRHADLGLSSLAGLTHVKGLGGSTGAQLYKNADGKQFVVKSGDSPGHVRNEQAADDVYRAAGVPVPKSKLVEGADGQPRKVSRFLENHQTLQQWEQGKTQGQKDELYRRLGKHALADVLLGNWDVVGLGKDNVLVSPGGTPVRADNGGALAYRAQGQLKLPGDWVNGSLVKDLTSMADPSKNPQFAAVMKMVPAAGPGSLQDQAAQLWANKDAILDAAHAHGPGAGDVLGKRLGEMATVFQVGPHAKPTAQPTPPTGPAKPAAAPPAYSGNLGSGPALLKYVTEKASGQVKPANLKKFGWLNPQGLVPGQPVYAHKWSGGGSELEALKQILPAGTKIKLVNVGLKDTEAGPFNPGKHAEAGKPLTATGAGQAAAVPPPPTTKPAAAPPNPNPDIKFPPIPRFESSNKAKVAENVQQAKVWLRAAKAGDLAGLKDSTQHPSPKLEAFKKSLIDALEKAQPKAAAPPGQFAQTPPTPGSGDEVGPAGGKLGFQGVPAGHVPSFAPIKPKAHPDLKKLSAPAADGTLDSQHGKPVNGPKNQAWASALTWPEKTVIASWKGSADAVRKSFFEMAADPSKPLTADAAAFKSAIDKSGNHIGLVYRGVHDKGGSSKYASELIATFKKIGVGAVWTKAAPHCTSPKTAVGVKFSHGELLMRILSRTGAPIWKSDGFSHEMEVAGRPGVRYRVVALHENVTVTGPGLPSYGKPHKMVVDLEEIV